MIDTDFRHVPFQSFWIRDLIVVDDDSESGPTTSVHAADSPLFHAGSRPKTVAERNIGPSRLRNCPRFQ